MRILMLVLGTRGDLEQMLSLARGLACGDHEVVVASSPFFRERVEATGIGFVAVGSGTREELMALFGELAAVDDQRRQVDIYVSRWLRPQLREGKEDLGRELARCDYTVNNLRMIWQRAGLPLPGALVTYDPPESARRLPLYTSRRIQHRGRILELVAMNRALVDPQLEWDEDFRFTGFWSDAAQANFDPPADLAQFLRKGTPPVVLTMGSMMMFDAGRLEAVYRDALRICGLRGILIGGWSKLSNTGPCDDGIYRASEIPYDWLLARARCLIHHGGSGSVGAALRTGCPSILLPCIISQHHFARILRRENLAVGDLRVREMQAPQLANALEEVEAIKEIAMQWSMRAGADGGVPAAVSMIESHKHSVHAHA